MSEAFHQHLNNLTLWEEIDRFFNPSKYSCSTFANPTTDYLWKIIIVMMVTIFIIVFLIRILQKSIETEVEQSDPYTIEQNNK